MTSRCYWCESQGKIGVATSDRGFSGGVPYARCTGIGITQPCAPVQGVEVYRWPERGPSRSRRDSYRRQQPRFSVSTLFAASLDLSADPGPSYFTTNHCLHFFFSQVPGSSGPVPLLVAPISRFPPRSTYSIPSLQLSSSFLHPLVHAFLLWPNSVALVNQTPSVS